MSLVDIAIDYHQRFGMNIVPCCDKKPLGKWKHLRTRILNMDELRTSFNRIKVNGLGCICGSVSNGIVCRDFDNPQAYADWLIDHAELGHKLPTVKTARGWHVWFRTGTEFLLNRTLDDGEYRGDGVFTVLPPSQHPTGVRYEWKYPPGEEIPYIDNPISAGLLPGGLGGLKPNLNGALCTPVHYAPLRLAPQPAQQPMTAKQWALSMEIPAIAQRCAPTRTGHRHFCLRKLVHDLVVQATPGQWGRRLLSQAFSYWWAIAQPVVATKNREVSWWEYIALLKTAKVCKQLPVTVPVTGTQLERLLAICRQLLDANGGQWFYMADKDVGELLGMARQNANKLIHLAIQRGRLRLLKRGRYVERKANEYTLDSNSAIKSAS